LVRHSPMSITPDLRVLSRAPGLRDGAVVSAARAPWGRVKAGPCRYGRCTIAPAQLSPARATAERQEDDSWVVLAARVLRDRPLRLQPVSAGPSARRVRVIRANERGLHRDRAAAGRNPGGPLSRE
jgi:hypothetical protein